MCQKFLQCFDDVGLVNMTVTEYYYIHSRICAVKMWKQWHVTTKVVVTRCIFRAIRR